MDIVLGDDFKDVDLRIITRPMVEKPIIIEKDGKYHCPIEMARFSYGGSFEMDDETRADMIKVKDDGHMINAIKELSLLLLTDNGITEILESVMRGYSLDNCQKLVLRAMFKVDKNGYVYSSTLDLTRKDVRFIDDLMNEFRKVLDDKVRFALEVYVWIKGYESDVLWIKEANPDIHKIIT